MTQREFYNAIANADLDKALVDFALEGIAKLDKKNSARTEKMSEVQKANLPLMKKILEMLSTDTAMLSTDIANALDVSTSKATGLLGNLLKEEKVTKVDIKVPKKGVQKGWILLDRGDEDISPNEIAYPPITV